MMTGFSRRGLMRLGLGAGLSGLLPRLARAGAKAGASGRRLLVYFNSGGWDTTQVFDPHFETDALDRDPDAVPASAGDLSYAHADSRPSVQRFFDQHGHRTVVVNGIGVSSISHGQATRIMMTGKPADDAADAATIVAAGIGDDLPLPFAVLSGPRYPGALGRYQVPLNHLLVGTARGELPAGGLDADREARLRAYLADVGQLRLDQGSDPRIEEFMAALGRRQVLDEGLAGLDVSEDSGADDQLATAVQALARGLSCCAIVQGEVPTMVGWDTHSDNDLLQDACYEATFDTLDQLVQTLSETAGPDGSPLIDTTTLLVVSEMGRLPLINAQMGKDHWPVTSAMLVGAGLDGGRVVGATDAGLNAEAIDLETGATHEGGALLSAAGLLAGLIESFGIDPGEHLPGVTPFRAPFSA